jgi:hypothetical protein
MQKKQNNPSFHTGYKKARESGLFFYDHPLTKTGCFLNILYFLKNYPLFIEGCFVKICNFASIHP